MDWDTIYGYAKTAGAKYPQVVAAQFMLESGGGKHMSGKNNPYGLKGRPGTLVQTQEWDGSKFVTIDDYFKDFESIEEATKYLIDRWYRNYSTYWGVNNSNSPEECARMLVQEKYATDPNYAELLIKIMAEHEGAKSFLEQAALYYNEEQHQKDAWRALEAKLDAATLESFRTAYRGAQKPVEGPPKTKGFPLAVPYFYQRDSKTGNGERMCFSSSMAMALDYLNPEAIKGDDDWYLQQVFRFGDTVSSDAQVKAAHYLGMDAEFHTDGRQADLERLLDNNTPVPIGILHKGPIDAPTGGGHYICLIGYNATHFMVHDPFGELDLINGGYPKAGPTDGKNQLYSKKNLMKRWLIANAHDGWYVDLTQN
jgi:hypothetical protein